MNSKYNPFLFAIALTLLLSGPCSINNLLAAPTSNGLGSETMLWPKSRVFSVHDINRDGYLNRAEYRNLLAQIEVRIQAKARRMRHFSPPFRFEEIDKNDDGYVTEDEMIIALNKRLRKHRRYRNHGDRW